MCTFHHFCCGCLSCVQFPPVYSSVLQSVNLSGLGRTGAQRRRITRESEGNRAQQQPFASQENSFQPIVELGKGWIY